jgi:hypothetical protein
MITAAGAAAHGTPAIRGQIAAIARTLALAAAISVLAASCIVRRLTGPQLTGTCSGACAHYVECRPGHARGDEARCRDECPDVFADRDSLMAFESLSCKDAVEFVDGTGTRAAARP